MGIKKVQCWKCGNLHIAKDGRTYCLIKNSSETLFSWISREKRREPTFCSYFKGFWEKGETHGD